jgi:hypothetical protein
MYSSIYSPKHHRALRDGFEAEAETFLYPQHIPHRERQDSISHSNQHQQKQQQRRNHKWSAPTVSILSAIALTALLTFSAILYSSYDTSHKRVHPRHRTPSSTTSDIRDILPYSLHGYDVKYDASSIAQIEYELFNIEPTVLTSAKKAAVKDLLKEIRNRQYRLISYLECSSHT